jgi:hypothetical protein
MSLIDPIQLMTLLGTTPERQGRSTRATKFQSHMSQAMGSGDMRALDARLGGSGSDNALMQSALNGLASLMQPATEGSSSRKGNVSHAGIGKLSATFESGTAGVNAIGYDKNGGTSYGTYQIASKPGTMKEFIESTHYQPARDKILAKTGVDMDSLPLAAREALWSTAVQHGPAGAARIFSRAIASIGANEASPRFAERLIDKVYESRKSQFESSTAGVQASVRERMQTEKGMVLAMLDSGAEGAA